MALGYQNPFYLKQAQQKQQSLYNGKVLLDKHDPPAEYDLEEALQLAQESPNESLDKITVLEKENERPLRVVASREILSIVQNHSVVDTSDLQIELECMKEKFETCIIKKENENTLQAQLGDLKGKSMNTQCTSDTLDPLSQKHDDENVSLEF
ncbi:hypothetical protein Tco_1446283 [Tanacetum coccineum]